MLDWLAANWEYIAGGASVLGLFATFYFGLRPAKQTTPPPRVEPRAVEPAPKPEPVAPRGHTVTVTNAKDSVVIGGARGTQPRNADPNDVRATNIEGTTIVGGNDKS